MFSLNTICSCFDLGNLNKKKEKILKTSQWHGISDIKGPIVKLMYGLDYKVFLTYWAGWRAAKS